MLRYVQTDYIERFQTAEGQRQCRECRFPLIEHSSTVRTSNASGLSSNESEIIPNLHLNLSTPGSQSWLKMEALCVTKDAAR